MAAMFNPFSQQLQDDIADDGHTGVVVEGSKESDYLKLVQRFPNIHFKLLNRAQGTFEVDALDQKFEGFNQSELLVLRIPVETKLSQGFAEVMARTMRLFAFNQTAPAQIVTENTAHEQLLLFACIDLKQRIKARTHEQRMRLLHFLKERSQGGISGAVVEARQSSEIYHPVDPTAEEDEVSLFSSKVRADEREKQFTQLIIEHEASNPFFNLLKEYGEMHFDSPDNNPYMRIMLDRDTSFKIENKAEQFSIGLLNTTRMKIGVTELIASIVDNLEGTPKEQRDKRSVMIRGKDRGIEKALYKTFKRRGKVKTRTPNQADRFKVIENEKAKTQQKTAGFSMMNMSQNKESSGSDYGSGR